MSTTLAKLREYETTFIINSELADDAAQEVVDRLRGVLEKQDAAILNQDNWGKKKMAYEVNGSPRGNYIVLHYAADATVVAELERQARNMEPVARFMTILHGDISDLEAKRAEVETDLRERAEKAAAEEAARQQAEAERAAAEAERAEKAAAAEAEGGQEEEQS